MADALEIIGYDDAGRPLVEVVGRSPRGRMSPDAIGGGSILVPRGGAKTVLNVSEDVASTWTLCLTRRDADPPQNATSATLDAPLVARIGFGLMRAHEILVRVDWNHGCLLTIPASSIRVDCEYPEVPGFTADCPQFVGAFVTRGVRPPSMGVVAQARLTDRLSLAAGLQIVVPVPNRATAVRLMSTRPDLAGSYELGFTSSAGRASTSWNVIPGTALEEYPLGAGMRAVILTNRAAVDVDFALQWSIAL